MTRRHATTTWNQSSKRDDVVDEAPAPSDSDDRTRRLAKNCRYNTLGTDLTAGDERLGPQEERERFVGHTWFRDQALFPASQADVVVLGTLVKAQPYLSTDRSNIYTELTIRVEEEIKTVSQVVTANTTLVIDRIEPGNVALLNFCPGVEKIHVSVMSLKINSNEGSVRVELR